MVCRWRSGAVNSFVLGSALISFSGRRSLEGEGRDKSRGERDA